MARINFIIIFFVSCINLIFSDEQPEINFQERKIKFASEGFGFMYNENEIENIDNFLLNHGKPLKTIEETTENRYDGINDKIVILEYENIIVTFYVWSIRTGMKYPTSSLVSIKSKDNVSYLYNIKHGMTIEELNKVIGDTEIIDNSIWLQGNMGNATTISIKNNQQPRPKGTGYVVLIRCLYSGFNTFFKRPKGRGIKPLNTNKIEYVVWNYSLE